MSKMKEERIF